MVNSVLGEAFLKEVWAMMNQVTFCTDLFERSRVGASSARSQKALGYYLWLLYQLNCDYLREFPQTVKLYDSGVIYRAETPSNRTPEQWCMIPEVMAQGHGDCEDLACWLAAELTVQQGVKARPFWTKKQFGNETVFHILTRAGRQTFDPSKVLGM